jgi:hypothetical protein
MNNGQGSNRYSLSDKNPFDSLKKGKGLFFPEPGNRRHGFRNRFESPNRHIAAFCSGHEAEVGTRHWFQRISRKLGAKKKAIRQGGFEKETFREEKITHRSIGEVISFF